MNKKGCVCRPAGVTLIELIIAMAVIANLFYIVFLVYDVGFTLFQTGDRRSELRALPPGGQLAVTAPFEPVPLIGLLARQGWRAWSRWDGGDCTVVFGREDGATSVEEAPLAGSPPVRRGDGWEVDVRGLVPPEPMRRVLACLDAEQLPLRVVHEREPALLYPQLAQRGLAWRVSSADGAVYVDVRRP